MRSPCARVCACGPRVPLHCVCNGAWCMVHGAWCMVHGAWCHLKPVFQKAGRTREKPDGKQNPAERR